MFTLFMIMPDGPAEGIITRILCNYPDYNINPVKAKIFPYQQDFDDKTIFLCDNDLAISYASVTGLPVIAYSHEGNASQSLMGAGWMIDDPDSLTPFYLNEVYCHHHHIPMTLAATGRFVIRELTPADLPGLLALQEENADRPEGCFFPASLSQKASPEKNPGILSDYREFLHNYILHQYRFYGYGIYAVISNGEPDVGDLIGIAGFSGRPSPRGSDDLPAVEDAVEVGYSLLKKYQGKQYATEILDILISTARCHMGITHFYAVIPDDNSASRHIAGKFRIPVFTG